MTYRIRYGRYDGVKYISHLDILKLFDRAARRANLPVAYSEGFNPHPLFVFGMPIPVGTTSEDEYVDITFCSELSCSDIIDKLNKALPESVRILEAKTLPEHAHNIFRSTVASRYRVEADLTSEELDFIVAEAGKKTALVVEKRTKSGTKPTDIREMIYDVHREGDALIMTLALGNEKTLRPDLAVPALLGRPIPLKSSHRLKLLTEEELCRK